MATTTAAAPLSTMNAVAAPTCAMPPPAPSSDRPTTSQSSNHRVVDINYHQSQQNPGGSDFDEHLCLSGGGRRGGRPVPARGYGSGHRGGYGFHRHRRDGWRGHHGGHGPEHIIGFLPPPPHYPPFLDFLPPPSFLTSPYFGACHEPAIGYAPHGEYYGSMIGHAHPGFAFPLPQQNIMPLIPFSVPPHIEQPEAPLTAEEREKKIREQIEYYFSENNLCSDVHLKGWMNQQGWVPLTLVAGFPRVQALTTDYEIVQRSLLSSTEVELQRLPILVTN
uniref:HTH La-type RNA-binding domain-containing protein n=1 Tax=Oryza glumipatula TaxID=40148 RepID=A0A0E0BAY1_9ORYZ